MPAGHLAKGLSFWQGPFRAVFEEKDMSCFRVNQVVRSEYVSGTDGFRRLFFRKKGTSVSQQADCGYTAGDDTLVIQWEGSPAVDSGYHARIFPPTMAGLRAAHAAMDSF